MKKYQILTIVHSHFSIRIIPENNIYSDEVDAVRQIRKLMGAFTENGEYIVYKGKITSTDDIFRIYQEMGNGEYCEAYIYELEEK